jgi:dihydrofolate reductase
MRISLIVAMDLESGIGKDGATPWHLRADLQRFKQITMGHAIVMGRKTYQSIGRALPGRQNIVVSRNPNFEAPGCIVVGSLEEALQVSSAQTGANVDQSEVMVIGGAQIFAQVFPQADKLYLTIVHTHADCQVFFPDIAWNTWKVLHQEYIPAGEKDQYSSTYYELMKKTS